MIKGAPQTITADGVIGVSGKPVKVFAVTIDSGASASVAAFHNGTADTDTLMFQSSGSTNLKVFVNNIPEEGGYFPAGCYVNVDSNLGSDGLTVWHEVVSVA